MFAVSEGVNLYTIIDNLTRPVPGELVVDRGYWDNGSLFRRYVYHYQANDTELLWDWSESYYPDVLQTTSYFEPPLSIRQANMPKGAVQGGGAVNTGTPEENVSNVTRVNTALDLDDIHLPFGTLSGCLRMFEEHNGISRISWYCPEVGLAKRLWGQPYDRVWELSECVGCPTP